MTTGLDLEDPAFLTGDRSAAYRALRDEAPVLRMGAPGEETWLLSRHEDVQAALAKVQLQETAKAIVKRFRRIALAGAANRHPSLIFPSLATLPVRVHR